MDVSVTDTGFSQSELAAFLGSAIVVAVMSGPGAITVVGVDSLLVTALSVGLMGALAFLVAVLTLIAIKRL